MRSTRPAAGFPDDRSTKARIRDAAIECFAEHGVAATTARKVAAAAGVSTGLVIHHFGSMDGLRAACDAYVAELVRQRKTEAMAKGPGLDPLAALRDGNLGPLMPYLARVLAEDSPGVNALVDELVSDAESYLQQGVENGMLRPSANPRGRAAVLTMWSLGALVLHRHVERILGVDLTAPDLGVDPAVAAYFVPALELMGEGVLTGSYAQLVRESFSSAAPQAKPPPESTPESTPQQGTPQTAARRHPEEDPT